MSSSSKLPHRGSTRLTGFDYSQPGAYFVTICCKDRQCLLGSISGGKVELTAIGQIAREVWNSLPDRFPPLVLDAFVIMPNHVHGVLGIRAVPGIVGAGLTPPAVAAPLSIPEAPKPSLPAIIGAFKSISTINVNRQLKTKGKQLWQRSYYEHIVRKGEDLRKIQQYILENPLMWSLDPENPTTNRAQTMNGRGKPRPYELD
jgi:REP element-mobilizing transposase RayT